MAVDAFATIASNLSTIWIAMPVFLIGMWAVEMGNGPVFQLVPQRLRRKIGIMTDLAGMICGVAGFYLASSLGYAQQPTRSYSVGFLAFAILATLALVAISGPGRRWRTTRGEFYSRGASLSGSTQP